MILDQKSEYIEYDEIRLEKGKEYKLESKFITKPHWWANQLYPSAKLIWVETSTSRNYEKEALDAAEKSDVIVFCGGISPRLEGEEMKLEIDGFAGGDRTHLKLPENQESLLKKLHATGKPLIYINFSGSAIALNWENENLQAIVQAFYPG
ncbi:MAG: glycoside hydrolase family 3 C-terminal domain-containing protein, partial [Bacteroidales bacterium]|nr:glycoside hydrolase family 3 C-terminal domain-containing protein [Bacteroidales bacterium]